MADAQVQGEAPGESAAAWPRHALLQPQHRHHDLHLHQIRYRHILLSPVSVLWSLMSLYAVVQWW